MSVPFGPIQTHAFHNPIH